MINSYHNISEIQVNPYITDGLMAMYDFKWNVGINKPWSQVTDKWKDISGNNRDIEIKDYHWSDEGLEVSKSGGIIIPPYILPSSNIAQIELVCLNYRSENDVNPAIGFEINGLESYVYDFGILGGHPYTGPARLGFKCHSCLIGLIDISTINLGTPVLFFSSETYDTINKENNKILLNGKTTQFFYQAHNPNFSGHLMMRVNKGFPSAIKCVRFYNRELTKSEILNNYYIDVERYGQPTV